MSHGACSPVSWSPIWAPQYKAGAVRLLPASALAAPPPASAVATIAISAKSANSGSRRRCLSLFRFVLNISLFSKTRSLDHRIGLFRWNYPRQAQVGVLVGHEGPRSDPSGEGATGRAPGVERPRHAAVDLVEPDEAPNPLVALRQLLEHVAYPGRLRSRRAAGGHLCQKHRLAGGNPLRHLPVGGREDLVEAPPFLRVGRVSGPVESVEAGPY